MTATIKEGLMEREGGESDELIEGELLSRALGVPDALGLEMASLGLKAASLRTNSLETWGSGEGASLTIKSGEDETDGGELSLGLREGLAVSGVLTLEGESEPARDVPLSRGEEVEVGLADPGLTLNGTDFDSLPVALGEGDAESEGLLLMDELEVLSLTLDEGVADPVPLTLEEALGVLDTLEELEAEELAVCVLLSLPEELALGDPLEVEVSVSEAEGD